MTSRKQKLRLIGAVATLVILATGVACKGFFVNPTVTAITIDPPNPTVSIGGAPVQLTAAGTDSNGNPLTLTAGTSCTGTTVCWSNSDPTVATLTTGGLLTAVAAGIEHDHGGVRYGYRHDYGNRNPGERYQHCSWPEWNYFL